MNEREQRELALSKIVLLIVVVIGVIGVIWLAWFHPLPLQQSVTSFEECKQAGNSVQGNPPTCTDKDGQRFIDDSQQRLLIFKEWGVQFPYPSNVRTLSYRLVAKDPHLALIRLEDVPGDCKGANQLRRAKAGENLDGLGNTPEMLMATMPQTVKHIDSYYYTFTRAATGCTKEGQDRLAAQIEQLGVGLEGPSIQKLQPVK